MTDDKTGIIEIKPEYNKYICPTCKHAKITVEHYEDGDMKCVFCNKIKKEIYLLSCEAPHEFFLTGCATHSDLKDWDSTRLIGDVEKIFNKRANPYTQSTYDWVSFYSGWMEGRINMLGELYGKGDINPPHR